MKVSVLVPVYGVEPYIEQCAHSLMRQTYDDIEFIFVDDCSPDGSIAKLKAIVAQYPQRASQVRIITHDRNRGLGAARLTALKAATGRCVMHVDSDDYVDTRCVELLVKRMNETGAMMVDGGYAHFKQDGTISTPIPPYKKSSLAYASTLLCQNIVFNRIWGRLMNRALLFEHDFLNREGIDYSEDFIIAPIVATFSRAWVDETLYFYRDDNAGSYTHTLSMRHHRSYLRSCAIVIDFFASKPEYARALDLCKLAVLRHVRRFNVEREALHEICPQALDVHLKQARLIAKVLMSNRVPYSLGAFIYRLYRRLFLIQI